jgi:hypothetical protein
MVDCGFDVLFCVVNAYFYVFCCGFMGFFDCWSVIFPDWHTSWGVFMAKLKKSELTQWFRYENVPIRYGVYEVDPHNGMPEDIKQRVLQLTERDRFYSFWNGKFWGWVCDTPDEAYQNRDMETGWEVGELPWRGIAGT